MSVCFSFVVILQHRLGLLEVLTASTVLADYSKASPVWTPCGLSQCGLLVGSAQVRFSLCGLTAVLPWSTINIVCSLSQVSVTWAMCIWVGVDRESVWISQIRGEREGAADGERMELET